MRKKKQTKNVSLHKLGLCHDNSQYLLDKSDSGMGEPGNEAELVADSQKGAQLTLQFVVSLLSTGTDTIAASLLVLTPLYNCSNKGGV